MRTPWAVLMIIASLLLPDQCHAQYFVTTGAQDYQYSQLFGTQVFGGGPLEPAADSMLGFPGVGAAGSGSFSMGSANLASYGNSLFENQAFPVWQETGSPFGISASTPQVGSNMAGVLSGGLPLFGSTGQSLYGQPFYGEVNTQALAGPPSQYSYDLSGFMPLAAITNYSGLPMTFYPVGATSPVGFTGGTQGWVSYNPDPTLASTGPSFPMTPITVPSPVVSAPTPTEAQFQAAARYYDTSVDEVKAIWSGMSPSDQQTYIGMF